jgi:hypothetical protein
MRRIGPRLSCRPEEARALYARTPANRGVVQVGHHGYNSALKVNRHPSRFFDCASGAPPPGRLRKPGKLGLIVNQLKAFVESRTFSENLW